MHDAGSADYSPAIRFRDALMSETDPQGRNLAAEAQDDVFTDAGFARSAWTGRDTNVPWRQRRDFIKRDLIMSFDEELAPKLTKILREIVGEGVVVIEKQEHRFLNL